MDISSDEEGGTGSGAKVVVGTGEMKIDLQTIIQAIIALQSHDSNWF